MFLDVLLHSWLVRPPGSPVTFESEFGWGLAVDSEASAPNDHITTSHTSLISGDDVLRRLCEIEEKAYE